MHKGLVVIGVGSALFLVVPLLAGFGGNLLALVWGPFAFVTGYFVSKWY